MTTKNTAETKSAKAEPKMTQKEIKARIAELLTIKESQLESKDRKGAKKTRRQIRNFRKLLPAPKVEKKASKKVNTPKAEVKVEAPVEEPAAA